MTDDPVLRFALATHTQTIRALVEYLDASQQDTTTLPRFAVDPATCSLGRWLERNRASHGTLPAYLSAHELHSEFHRCLNDIVGLVRSGKRADALERLRAGSAFSRLSRRLLLAFDELAEAIERREI